MADTTTLTVSPQVVNIQVGQTRTLDIQTNDDNWTFSVTPEDIISFDRESRTITAVGEGSCNITIQAKYNQASTVQAVVNVNVEQLTTKLTVLPTISTLNIGESQVFKVDTDADDYEITNNNRDIIAVDKSTSTILGVSSGTGVVIFTATKQHCKTATVTWNVTVAMEEGIPVKLKLVNKSTGRTTVLQTSNNLSTKDVTIKLPAESGTLMTEEELDTAIKVVQQPRITYPLNNATNVEDNIQATAFSAILGFQGSHTHTEWEIASDDQFTNVLKYKKCIGAQGHKLTEISPSVAGSKVYVRVRYWSGEHSSLWSDTVTFTTGLVGPAGPQTVIKGNCATAAYFGEVPFSDCIADRDYFGNWETLNKIAANYNGENLYKDNGVNSGDYLVNAPKGSQVHYKGKLYYAKEYLTMKTNTFQIEPGTDDTKWVEDTRENLPTPKKFVFDVGIGYNARPNKLNGNLGMGANDGADWHRDAYPDNDKPTSLPNYIYPWGMSAVTYNTVPTAYDIPECSWLKFGYKGKILYTPKIPLLCSIAWNDLAKVHAVYGDRTMRIGSRLYWYRLLKEEEYKALLVGLTDGTLGDMDSKDLDLDEKTLDSTKNIFRNSINSVWLEDFREGTSRRTITGAVKDGISNVVVTDKSPRSACGVYRPVLELIPEGEEPYNNLPLMPMCYDENFQYDKYTDTGFFGRIKAANFINGDTLCATVGLTAGSSYLPNYDWLKFYYHGQIVFLPMSPLRHSVSWVNKNNANILYGCDLGGRGRTDVKIGEFVFSVEETHNCHSTPRWNDDTWQDHWIAANGYEAYNTRGRVNLHSMVQDLLVRVTGSKIRGRDFMYSTNELTESGVWCNTTYDNEYACHQIGDNWAEFTLAEMCVKHCDGFSGTAWHGKYLYSYLGSNYSGSAWVDKRSETTNSPHPWHHGGGRVGCHDVASSVDSYWGLRSALYLRS